MRNVFKGKNLTHLLYGILMLLPFCSILARVIYVQSNQNALDSYYGENINQVTTNYASSNNYDSNILYYYDSRLILNTEYSGSFYGVIKFVTGSDNITSSNIDFINSSVRAYCYRGTSTTFYDNENNSLVIAGFVLITISNLTSATNVYHAIYYYTYIDYSYLDNVFDYSLHNFIEDNNYNVDFFGWFNNLFLNQSGKNLLYLNFVNWYLNYALLVSAGYILFLLFLWFINFARKLLEGGNSFGHGGF